MIRRFLVVTCLLLACSAGAQSRRNSFVTELLDVQGPRPGSYTVLRPERGWLYLRLDGTGGPGATSLQLDGERVLGGSGETMRLVSAGEHALHLEVEDGARPQRLTVRAVPEIVVYMMEYRDMHRPSYWYTHSHEFLERSILPHCNTVVSQDNAAYATDAQAWQERGGAWLCNQGMTQLRDPEADLVAYWRSILTRPMFDGVMHDEVLAFDPVWAHKYYDPFNYPRWAQALPQALAGLPGKRVYFFAPPGVALGDPDWAAHFALDSAHPGEGNTSLRCAPSPDRLRTFRQINVELAAGGTYTLSCLMRVANASTEQVAGGDAHNGSLSGVLVINKDWLSDCGSRIEAADAGDQWKTYARTFRAPASRDGKYQLIICPPAHETMWLDAFRLEAGATVGGGENLLTNSGLEDGWRGWIVPGAGFEELAKLVRDNDCRLGIETYIHEAEDEVTARSEIADGLIGCVAKARQNNPGLESGLTVFLGAGNAPLRYCDDLHPEVCYKAHLDLQFHAAANSPEFEDVAGIGLWTLHYIDEETVRWYGALFRHYLIEGSRERLAPWPYRLDHLTNSGFETGTQGWVIRGEAEVVQWANAFPGVQRGRDAHVPEGNCVLVTRKTAGENGSFGQTIRNLLPGRLYTLKLYVTDREWSERDISVDILIENVEMQVELDEHRVWMDHGKRFWNMHRHVFRAQSNSAQLTVRAAASAYPSSSKEPQALIWDFVQVEPYFESR